MAITALSIFGAKEKIALTGVRKSSNLILLTLLFAETYLFTCKKVLADNLKNKLAKLRCS